MQNINPTATRTITRENDTEITVSEWIVGDYTLTRTSDGERVDWEADRSGRDVPEIVNVAGFGESVRFGIYWGGGHGAVDADEAKDYAAKVMVAATIADQFNAIIAAN